MPREGVVVLELYSGCGVHSCIVSGQLRENLWVPQRSGLISTRKQITEKRTLAVVTQYSIDLCGDATLRLDARGLTQCSLALFRSRIPNKRVVLLASPPCTAYSIANTTGIRNLQLADQLVTIVQQVHYGLDCDCTIMENPATGMLPRRDVANDFLPHTDLVHYCAHGSGYFHKPTMLWSGPKPFNLRDNGFIPKLCAGQGGTVLVGARQGRVRQGKGVAVLGRKGKGRAGRSKATAGQGTAPPLKYAQGCPIMYQDWETKAWRHPPWEGTHLQLRQSIPAELSREIGIAVCKYMNNHPKVLI